MLGMVFREGVKICVCDIVADTFPVHPRRTGQQVDIKIADKLFILEVVQGGEAAGDRNEDKVTIKVIDKIIVEDMELSVLQDAAIRHDLVLQIDGFQNRLKGPVLKATPSHNLNRI